MISQVETFLYPDKQGTPEEGRRIQWPKRCEKKNKDEDNSPKTLTDKNHQVSSQKFRHRKNLFTRATLKGNDSSQSCIYFPYTGVSIFQILDAKLQVRTIQENTYSNMGFFKQNNPQENLYNGDRKKKTLKYVFSINK